MKLMFQRFSILVMLTFAGIRAAGEAAISESLQPDQTIDGVIRVWGDDQMDTVLKRWQADFQKQHPSVRFETRLLGTGTGMAGLYSGVADIALLGREATSSEVMAFEWVFRYKPMGIEVATGSLDVP